MSERYTQPLTADEIRAEAERLGAEPWKITKGNLMSLIESALAVEIPVNEGTDNVVRRLQFSASDVKAINTRADTISDSLQASQIIADKINGDEFTITKEDQAEIDRCITEDKKGTA